MLLLLLLDAFAVLAGAWSVQESHMSGQFAAQSGSVNHSTRILLYIARPLDTEDDARFRGLVSVFGFNRRRSAYIFRHCKLDCW